jgi:hypothetical protein
VDDEGNGRSERKRLLIFCNGNGNDYAGDDCNGNDDGND